MEPIRVLSPAALRRQAKRVREHHTSRALAPRYADTGVSYDDAMKTVLSGPSAHLGSYHGSSHARITAPSIPTGLIDRYVGFELELVPHMPQYMRDIYGRAQSPLHQFFGYMQKLATLALPSYWSKIERDSTVDYGAEFISGYGPIHVHHVGMMGVLCDPSIARIASAVNEGSDFSTIENASRGTVRYRCTTKGCLACGKNPIPDGTSERHKLGKPQDKPGCGMHVHIHATDRLGRRLNQEDRRELGSLMAGVITDLHTSCTSGDDTYALPAMALWDMLVGREPTQFCTLGCGGHYSAINVEADRTPTIEVRSFRATVNPRQFFARLEFSLALFEYALDAMITGVGRGEFGEFVGWLDECAAARGMASALPNLLATLAEHPYPATELSTEDEPCTWLADPHDDRSADAEGEDEPEAEEEDEDESWHDPDSYEDEDEEEDEDDEDEDTEERPSVADAAIAAALQEREEEIDALAASENIDSEQAADALAPIYARRVYI